MVCYFFPINIFTSPLILESYIHKYDIDMIERFKVLFFLNSEVDLDLELTGYSSCQSLQKKRYY